MLSLLEKLWDFYQSEHPFETDADRRALMEAIADSEERLLSTLNEEQRQLYRTFCDLQGDYHARAEQDAFVAGIRLASEFHRETAV